jgi:hypothetical protein
VYPHPIVVRQQERTDKVAVGPGRLVVHHRQGRVLQLRPAGQQSDVLNFQFERIGVLERIVV